MLYSSLKDGLDRQNVTDESWDLILDTIARLERPPPPLQDRYESFSINEAWANRDIETGKQLSTMFQMNSTVYDQVICDPWWGNSPHENLLPKEFKKRPMVLSFVRKQDPLHTADMFEEYVRDNFLMKTLHLLAQDYKDYVYFSYVNMATDEDYIGATLGIDILNRIVTPVSVLIHENQVFLLPYEVQSYSDFVEYIEGGYKTKAVILLPLARRAGTLSYICKLFFRKVIDVFKEYQGDVRILHQT